MTIPLVLAVLSWESAAVPCSPGSVPYHSPIPTGMVASALGHGRGLSWMAFGRQPGMNMAPAHR